MRLQLDECVNYESENIKFRVDKFSALQEHHPEYDFTPVVDSRLSLEAAVLSSGLADTTVGSNTTMQADLRASAIELMVGMVLTNTEVSTRMSYRPASERTSRNRPGTEGGQHLARGLAPATAVDAEDAWYREPASAPMGIALLQEHLYSRHQDLSTDTGVRQTALKQYEASDTPLLHELEEAIAEGHEQSRPFLVPPPCTGSLLQSMPQRFGDDTVLQAIGSLIGLRIESYSEGSEQGGAVPSAAYEWSSVVEEEALSTVGRALYPVDRFQAGLVQDSTDKFVETVKDEHTCAVALSKLSGAAALAAAGSNQGSLPDRLSKAQADAATARGAMLVARRKVRDWHQTLAVLLAPERLLV